MFQNHGPGCSFMVGVTLLALGGCVGRPSNEFTCTPCDTYPQVTRINDCPTGQPDPAWRNLVFQGGGVRAIGYGGALRELNARGHLEPVERVAGTSAGAITATLLALGHNACEVSDYARDFPYVDFADGEGIGEVPRLVNQYGLHPGDFFKCTMRCLVDDALGDPDASFAELARRIEEGERSNQGRAMKQLYVVATDISTEDAVTLSHESPHADIAIAEGVRYSMSIPLFFRAQVLETNDREHLLVDGGVVRNYAIDEFDQGNGINARTLGLHLSEGRRDYYAVENVLGFTEQLVNTMSDGQVDLLCAAPYNIQRTVFIDTFDTRVTDFHLSEAQRACLVTSGRYHMRRFLDHGPDTACPDFVLPRTGQVPGACLEMDWQSRMPVGAD